MSGHNDNQTFVEAVLDLMIASEGRMVIVAAVEAGDNVAFTVLSPLPIEAAATLMRMAADDAEDYEREAMGGVN